MIYAKTQSGLAAMQDRTVAMTPRQRSAFIMFDGKRDSAEVLKMTAGVGVTQSDFDHILSLGLLVESGLSGSQPTSSAALVVSAPTSVVATSPQTADRRPNLSAQAHYSMAYPIAIRLTAGLGLRGFRLNLAVEAAGDIEKLKELAPKIRDAVGVEKFQELDDAMNF